MATTRKQDLQHMAATLDGMGGADRRPAGQGTLGRD